MITYKLKKYYFTFGSGQTPYNNNHYVVITAKNEFVAREIMFDHVGDKWSFCYKSARDAGVDMFGLEEIFFDNDEENVHDLIF